MVINGNDSEACRGGYAVPLNGSHGILLQVVPAPLPTPPWRTTRMTQKATAKALFGKQKSLGWKAMLKCSMPLCHITTRSSRSLLNSRMPTEREHSNYNDLGHDVSKYKHDSNPTWRLPFMRHIDSSSVSIKSVIIWLLALYGLYSLIF